MIDGILDFARVHRWSWAAIAVVALWVSLAWASGRFGTQSLETIGAAASFLAIVAVGQTFAISTGGGNIDLSVAGVVTFAAFVANVAAGHLTSSPIPILMATIGAGALVGVVNGALVAYLQMPAIIVTLGTGYVLATAALLADPYMLGSAGYGALDFIANGSTGPFPNVTVIALLAVLAGEFTLRRTTYGKALVALGQNERAAALAGLDTRRTIVVAFVISGVLGGLAGALLSARLHGAFLGMGEPYLIQSIGAVVIGGTAIAGGNSTFVGSLLGSLMLVLVVTTMQVIGLAIGIQEVVEGLLITALLAVAR